MKFLLSLISALTGWLARIPCGALSPVVIRIFAVCTGVNLRESKRELSEYPTVDSFFTRELKNGVRNFEGGIASPCDGAIRCVGSLENEGIITVKGTTFTPYGITQAVDCSVKCFAILYLSPKDYHRVHVPHDGTLVSIQHIPGNLFPVNGLGHIVSPRLYETNERVVFRFHSEILGDFFLVMVGALNVGKISYVDENGDLRQLFEGYNAQPQRSMVKGEQLGVFHLGSSVVLLFSKNMTSKKIDGAVRLGEKLFNL